MKALLYVKKEKPYLVQGAAKPMHTLDVTDPFNFDWKLVNKGFSNDRLNGKIVAECDYEVEEIFEELYGDLDWLHDYLPTTNTMSIVTLERKSCLNREELCNYNGGYAIHVSNLNVFNKPRELNDYYTKKKNNIEENGDLFMDGILYTSIKSAPRNMMYAKQPLRNDKILIPISSQEAHNILNYEQDVLIRRNVLKEMK